MISAWFAWDSFGKSNSKLKNLTPRLNILGKNGKLLKLDSGAESSYEIPVDANLVIDTDGISVSSAVKDIISYLQDANLIQ